MSVVIRATIRDEGGKIVPSKFNGRRCGLKFADGQAVAETLTDAQRWHFQRWGYEIEGDNPPKKSAGRPKKDDGKTNGGGTDPGTPDE